MKPTWIINFSKKEPFGSFFDTYWQASLYNDREQQSSDSDKWFYCYDAAADSVSYEQLYQTARQLTADLSDSQPRLIANLAGNHLRLTGRDVDGRAGTAICPDDTARVGEFLPPTLDED